MRRAETDLRELVEKYVADYVAENEGKQETKYRLPVVGFADAGDPLFGRLREVAVRSHVMPRDILADASTVISVFLPFSEDVVKSNSGARMASREWAVAYTETNSLLDGLSFDLADELRRLGYSAQGIKTTHHLSHAKKDVYAYDELFSNWSQKHVAYIAGVGTFGLNGLIITERGCAGRIGSLVTSAKIKPTERPQMEGCLVKRGLWCYRCVERCPVGAIGKNGEFDRVGCMNYLVEQRKYQEQFYKLSEGTQTCGKCDSAIPCDVRIPVNAVSESVP